jgi:acyl-CoA synthetase (AMP-forming)/AMP-acid ligase II
MSTTAWSRPSVAAPHRREFVSSAEIESVLASYPGVSEVAAIGIPDPDWGP